MQPALCSSVPQLLGPRQLSASVTDLSPWVEYEFRVLATNSIGPGEPSRPSSKTRTRDRGTYGGASRVQSAAAVMKVVMIRIVPDVRLGTLSVDLYSKQQTINSKQ